MSPNPVFGWVLVLAHGLKSQSGFLLGSSPGLWVQVPIWILAAFKSQSELHGFKATEISGIRKQQLGIFTIINTRSMIQEWWNLLVCIRWLGLLTIIAAYLIVLPFELPRRVRLPG